MQGSFLLLVLALAFGANAWVVPAAKRGVHTRSSALNLLEVATTTEIPNGERKLVDTYAGTVIVTNVDGAFFAVNAKCPHLGLPMKKVPV
jgi:hypothetical protein